MFRAIQFVFVMAAFFVMPVVVAADSIPWLVDTNTGAKIYDDNFEAGTLGSLPVAGPGTDGYVLGAGSTMAVVNAASGGFAAYQGSQYLKLTRTATDSGSCQLWGYGDASKSGSGDTIKLQMAFRSDGASTNAQVVLLPLTGGNENGEFLFNGNGSIQGYGPSGWVTLTQTFGIGVWNTLVLTHINNGGEAYSLSVNRAAPETVTATGWGSGNFNGVEVCAGNDGAIVSFDAVPEPSAIVLLATGLIGLLAYAWRKRS